MKLELKQKISKAKPDTTIRSLCLYYYYGGLAARIEKVLENQEVSTFEEMINLVESYGGAKKMKPELKGLGWKGAEVIDQIVKLYQND